MNNRRERVAELLKSEIAAVLTKSRYGGFGGIITITCVKVSISLEDATVFYSVLGGGGDGREQAAHIFARAKHEIVTALRARLRMKRIPRLVFAFDPTPAQAARVESILDFIDREKGGPDDKTAG
ncbi:MAG: ribosome-binding factor A [Elusimicrobiales bacterium]|nr:ribosome-binding factor A [Elusimicrobiales bacterium]